MGAAMALSLLMAASRAPGQLGPGGPQRRPSSQPTTTSADLGKLKVDPKAGTVQFKAEVCLREGALELLMCRAKTKEHESILRTQVVPSHLHAALLALGLQPGKPARWVGSDFVPPQGPELAITLKYTDKKGDTHEVAASEWIRSVNPKVSLPEKWVFVGSEVYPDGSYWANAEGDIITVSNFPSAVIDVPFESTEKNANLAFAAEDKKVPPLGTEVLVTIKVLPGARKSPYARVLLDIDRFGRLKVDGEAITFEQLSEWAGNYLEKHEHGMVVVRAAGRAIVADIMRATEELRIGGVRDLDIRYLPATAPVLPRTPRQAGASLKQWNHRFANPRDYIRDPGEEAREYLRHVDFRIRELEAMREMLQDYRKALAAAAEQYETQKKSQPAEDE